MPAVIGKPSQLVSAIAEALRIAVPEVKVGNNQDFDSTGDSTWVLISIEHDAPGERAHNGRIAHVLSVSLQAILPTAGLAACDLASELKNLVTDNCWKLPGDQCDLPLNIDGIASTFTRDTRQYNAWTVSFTQTLYLGPLLLDDPLGTPKFARTWEVSNIDDPDQYTALEG
ncbi:MULTISPECIES: hypothetical protein [unclassified Pseudomonas]|uniref:hypothetical protein n=1 Tax=unclassified Pseudomonas TaxID=196821 RepID=UPI002AC8EE41|nr:MULTISPECIES: hypothetical protein [unclassified Pseudomonas]MEB0045742.1 hypothetical protein [Pseudomonas sp. Dout3]MEB0098155.1 hypothetical protein [Pseudomonas sp. DC1.2]WPX60113.1 hypothetical protein RHM68_05595 [Pseudomonas sp. DC1.2]